MKATGYRSELCAGLSDREAALICMNVLIQSLA
jgi:hypothetical protein